MFDLPLDARCASVMDAWRGSPLDARCASVMDAWRRSPLDARCASVMDVWRRSPLDARCASVMDVWRRSPLYPWRGSLLDPWASVMDAWRGSLLDSLMDSLMENLAVMMVTCAGVQTGGQTGYLHSCRSIRNNPFRDLSRHPARQVELVHSLSQNTWRTEKLPPSGSYWVGVIKLRLGLKIQTSDWLTLLEHVDSPTSSNNIPATSNGKPPMAKLTFRLAGLGVI
jgi:hypothetical protein